MPMRSPAKVKGKNALEDGTFEFVVYDHSEIRVKDGAEKREKEGRKETAADREIKSPEGK